MTEDPTVLIQRLEELRLTGWRVDAETRTTVNCLIRVVQNLVAKVYECPLPDPIQPRPTLERLTAKLERIIAFTDARDLQQVIAAIKNLQEIGREAAITVGGGDLAKLAEKHIKDLRAAVLAH